MSDGRPPPRDASGRTAREHVLDFTGSAEIATLRKFQWRTMADHNLRSITRAGRDPRIAAGVLCASVLVWVMRHPEQAQYWNEFFGHDVEGLDSLSESMAAILATDAESIDGVLDAVAELNRRRAQREVEMR